VGDARGESKKMRGGATNGDEPPVATSVREQALESIQARQAKVEAATEAARRRAQVRLLFTVTFTRILLTV
jgi:hypothetical protein